MAIDYHNGLITEVNQPLIHEAIRIRDMGVLSEAYCASSAVWFAASTEVMLDLNEIAYPEGRISMNADTENWFRILLLPDDLGYLVDGSHLVEVQDDAGKFILPLDVYNGEPYEGAETAKANDYIRNTMQLDGASAILRNLYAYELGKSILHRINDEFGILSSSEDDDEE